MLDLNDFKRINDEFGHFVGDEALVATTQILQKAVGSLGIVIRYAGDEFIVLINTQDDTVIQKCIEKIQNSFELFNSRNDKPYKLSASIGSHKLNLKEESVDTFINTIDARMYESKKAFYAAHRVMDRRKR